MSAIAIFVKKPGESNERKLDMEPTDTLAELRKKLVKEGGNTSGRSRFRANGKALGEGFTLKSQGIKDGDRVHMVGLLGH